MDSMIQVLDEKKPFKLSSDFIKDMVKTAQDRLGEAVEEVLKVGEFKVGDRLEFSYIIDFEKDHVGIEVEEIRSRSEPLIQIQRS